MEKEEEQVFVIAGILVNSDKFIDRQYAEQVRRWLSMTKVFQIFEEEKLEAVNEAVNKKSEEFVEKLLLDGIEVLQIMKYTGLTRKQIEEIRSKVNI